MLEEHKNFHFVETEHSTNTNNYWHPKNNIRVLTTETNDQKRMNLLYQLLQVL